MALVLVILTTASVGKELSVSTCPFRVLVLGILEETEHCLIKPPRVADHVYLW